MGLEGFNSRKENHASDKVPEIASTLEVLKARTARIDQPADTVQEERMPGTDMTLEQEEDLSDLVQTLLKKK